MFILTFSFAIAITLRAVQAKLTYAAGFPEGANHLQKPIHAQNHGALFYYPDQGLLSTDSKPKQGVLEQNAPKIQDQPQQQQQQQQQQSPYDIDWTTALGQLYPMQLQQQQTALGGIAPTVGLARYHLPSMPYTPTML